MKHVRGYSGTSQAGASMVELVVAIMVFAVGVLGMAHMGLVARQQVRAGRLATDMWTVAHLKLEEIKATHFDSVAAGTDTVRGYGVSWTVTGADPKSVTLTISRPSVLGGPLADTVVLLLPNWEGS